MTDTSVVASEAKRFRSPPYPGLGLAKAIDRAKQLYAKALHHAVGPNVMADAWGYGLKSSALTTTAAALGQYDLLFAAGAGDKRRYQLTDYALRIIRDADPNSEKRKMAVSHAALNPAIHRELWEKFKAANGVHEVVLKNYLTLDRADEGNAAFSDAAADDVIRTYKETINFVGLSQSDSVSPDNSDMVDVEDEGQIRLEKERVRDAPRDAAPEAAIPQRQPDQPREAKFMAGERELTTGMLSKGAGFRLIVSGQIGVKEIERLIAKLEIDKEILAETDDKGDGDPIG